MDVHAEGGGLYNYFMLPDQLRTNHLLEDFTPIYSLEYTGPSDLPKFWREVMGMKRFALGNFWVGSFDVLAPHNPH